MALYWTDPPEKPQPKKEVSRWSFSIKVLLVVCYVLLWGAIIGYCTYILVTAP